MDSGVICPNWFPRARDTRSTDQREAGQTYTYKRCRSGFGRIDIGPDIIQPYIKTVDSGHKDINRPDVAQCCTRSGRGECYVRQQNLHLNTSAREIERVRQEVPSRATIQLDQPATDY